MARGFYDHFVRRTNPPRTNAAAGPWQALVLDLEQPRAAGLQMQVAGRGRLMLAQNGQAELLALVHPDRVGVDCIRTGRYRSPISPIPRCLASWALERLAAGDIEILDQSTIRTKRGLSQ